MIFTDGVHLISDSSMDELQAFAQKIGLKKIWFQCTSKYPHYDLTTERMAGKAIVAGAKKITKRQLVEKLQFKVLFGRHFSKDVKNYVCECGEACVPWSAKWRWNGENWQHYHGDNVGHVDVLRKA